MATKTNNGAPGTLASLLGVEKGTDGRYAVRLSDKAKADEFINSHFVVCGVPKARHKKQDEQ